MNVTIKVSIIAGLIAAALSPLSHASEFVIDGVGFHGDEIPGIGWNIVPDDLNLGGEYTVFIDHKPTEDEVRDSLRKGWQQGLITIPPGYVAPVQAKAAPAIVTPPVLTTSAPTPITSAVAPANPAAPVIKTPQKQTQGGGVWAKAPDIKGTFAGDSTTVIRNQNMVQAQRPSTPMIVNPDVIGQPVSTTVITKNTDTMAQGHNDPTGVPVETVTHNLPAPQPAAQDGIKDTPVHSTTTYINQIAPAIAVDKWGVNHTVETIDSANVKTNVTNAKDNSTVRATPSTLNLFSNYKALYSQLTTPTEKAKLWNLVLSDIVPHNDGSVDMADVTTWLNANDPANTPAIVTPPKLAPISAPVPVASTPAPVAVPTKIATPKAPPAPVVTPAASAPVAVPPAPVQPQAPKPKMQAVSTAPAVVAPTQVTTPVAPPVTATTPAATTTAAATPKANKKAGYKAGMNTHIPGTAVFNANTQPPVVAQQPSKATQAAVMAQQAQQQAVQVQQQYQQAQAQQAQNAAAWQQQATQAVNSLIDAHNENVALLNNHEGRISSLESHDKQQDKTIADNNKKAMAGIAGALAQTGLHYTDSANSIAAGVGNYAGENAIAVGYSHQWGNSVRFSVQNSADTAHNFGASASVAVGW